MPEVINEIDPRTGEVIWDSYYQKAKAGLIYVAQDGAEYRPRYKVIPFARKKKHKDFNFVERQGTYVQDLGWESGVIRLSVYFAGAEHDLEAASFERSLTVFAPGVAGQLYLPLDTIDRWRTVTPVEYTRTVDYVEAANRTVFVITFKESIPLFKEGEAEVRVRQDYASAVNAVSNVDLNSLKEDEGAVANLRETAQRIKKAILGDGSFIQRAGNWVTGSETYRNLSGFAKELGSALDYISENAQLLVQAPYQLSSLLDGAMQRTFAANIPQSVSVLSGVLTRLQDIDNTLLGEVKGNTWVRLLFGAPILSGMARYAETYPYLSRTEAVATTENVIDAYQDFISFLHDQEDVTAELNMTRRFIADPVVMDYLQGAIRDFTSGINARLSTFRQELTVQVTGPTTPLNVVSEYYPQLFKKDPIAALNLFEKTNEIDESQHIVFKVGDSFKVLV